MSTRWESYCNTTTDLLSVEPAIDSYDRKRLVTGFEGVGDVYTLGNAGHVVALFRDGVYLGAAQATAEAVNNDGEWHYDSTTDTLTLCSSSSPTTKVSIEAGRVWSEQKEEAVARASEFVRCYLAKPILKRTGTGSHGASLRDWDDTIIRATAYLACAELIEPYDHEKAERLQTRAYNTEYDAGKFSAGLLDMIKRGDIALWNEVSAAFTTGAPQVVSVSADTTGGIIETIGAATVAFDRIGIQIVTGGTFEEGAASPVTYRVLVSDSTGLKMAEAVSEEEVNGSYQALAHGIYGRFAPGKYSASDEWEVEVRGGAPEAGARAGNLKLTRF